MRNYGRRTRKASENYHLEPSQVGNYGVQPCGDVASVRDNADVTLPPVTTFNTSWLEEPMTNLPTGISGLYAMILVTVYVAFSFTELVRFPDHQKILEKNGFFLYLFLLADWFLVYTFGFTLKGIRKEQRDGDDFRIVENHRVSQSPN